MYAEGQGVTQNYTRAYMWWSIAAGKGHEESKVDLVAVEKEMTPTQVNKAKELALACAGKTTMIAESGHTLMGPVNGI